MISRQQSVVSVVVVVVVVFIVVFVLSLPYVDDFKATERGQRYVVVVIVVVSFV